MQRKAVVYSSIFLYNKIIKMSQLCLLFSVLGKGKRTYMTIQEEQLSMHEKDLQRLNELCLMDDDFFSEALDGKKEAVGYILNTVL